MRKRASCALRLSPKVGVWRPKFGQAGLHRRGDPEALTVRQPVLQVADELEGCPRVPVAAPRDAPVVSSWS